MATVADICQCQCQCRVSVSVSVGAQVDDEGEKAMEGRPVHLKGTHNFVMYRGGLGRSEEDKGGRAMGGGGGVSKEGGRERRTYVNTK